MTGRYGQILLTYFRRWHVRFGLLLIVANLAMALWLPRDVSGRNWLLLIQVASAAAILAATFVEHLKEQLADARAALTPRFRPPHVLVWIALMVVTVALVPALMQPLISEHASLPFDRLGIVAFVAIWATAIGWVIHFPSPYTIVPFAAILSLLASRTIEDLLNDMLIGRAPGAAVVLLAGSLTLLALLVLRFLWMSEESADWRRATTNWWLRASMTGDPALREAEDRPSHRSTPLRRLMQVSAIARYGPHALRREPPGGLFGESWWWRVRHYRMLSLAGWKPIGLAAAVVGLFMTLVIVIAMNDRDPARAIQYSIGIALFMQALAPRVIVGFIWPRRWLTVSYEAMLPSTRRRVIAESGLAMLLDQLSLWFWCQILGWSIWFIMELVLHMQTSSVVLVDNTIQFLPLLGMLLLSLGPQLLVFSGITLVMRLRSALLSFLVLFPIALAPLFPWMVLGSLGMRWPNDRDAFVACWVLTMLIAFLLTAVSYWSWCRADFE
jgi:hypothetical protein